MWWEKTDYRKKAYEYNKEWKEFFETNSDHKVTTAEIMNFVRTLSKEYHFEIYF